MHAFIVEFWSLGIGCYLFIGAWYLGFNGYLEPQVEQLVAEQPPQEELAVLLNFPPLEKAKADITR
jgi:hypothetical protein